MRDKLLILCTAVFVTGTLVAGLALAEVTITEGSGQRCFETDGLPDHPTGRFPNSGNPNSIQEQNATYCVTMSPSRNPRANSRVMTTGIALNGILIRPNTADFYDADSPRGFSRDSSSGWSMEGVGNKDSFGIDLNNAHVDEQGIYHYHGMPADLVRVNGDTLMGYAADGFEIHYRPDLVQSSYVLKSGTRPSDPYGRYDGRFIEDWEYLEGAGNLDECNGAEIDGGQYVYFATDTYPYFPRCLWGDIAQDFEGPRGQGGPRMSGGAGQGATGRSDGASDCTLMPRAQSGFRRPPPQGGARAGQRMPPPPCGGPPPRR